MEPIFDLPADLPKHAETPLEARSRATVVAEWPVGTFVENVAILQDGGIVVAVHTANRVERGRAGWPPLHGGDAVRCPRRVWWPAATVAFMWRAAFPVSRRAESGGWTPAATPRWPSRFPTRCSSTVRRLLMKPSLLAADSIRGCLYLLDIGAGTVESMVSARAARQGDHLRLSCRGRTDSNFSINHVYVTNTDRALVVRIPIECRWSPGQAGGRGRTTCVVTTWPSTPSGNAYLATHIENSVVRLSPTGDRLAIAGPDEGMPGSTAVAFGRNRRRPDQPLRHHHRRPAQALRPNVVQTAKLVRLEVGVEGAAFPFAV